MKLHEPCECGGIITIKRNGKTSCSDCKFPEPNNKEEFWEKMLGSRQL